MRQHFSLQAVDQNTLDDFLNLNSSEEMRTSIRARVIAGQLAYEQLYVVRSASTVEAAFTHSTAPMVLPRIRLDASDEAVQHTAQAMYDLFGHEQKTLILDSRLSPLNIDCFTAAGWRVKGHHKLYDTDLTSREWNLDSRVIEQTPADLLAPEMLAFYSRLLTKDDFIGDTGSDQPATAFAGGPEDQERLFVIREGGQVLAAATLRPSRPGSMGIHLLGVVPSARNAGWGGRLHAHLLALAKSEATRHVGGTNASNAAMQRIYERNGSELTSEQVQLTAQ